VTALSTIDVSSGSPVPLTWETAGVNTDQSEIFIYFSVNVHGTVTGWIECTVPDTGSFDIPASLVTDLIGLGITNFPSMQMNRRSVDSTDLSTGDCVDFEVGSQVTIELTVDGLVSCSDNTDCPEGQTCSTEGFCE
jgi:Cys-rich repeat protein